jgi:ribosomal biogenesis protein LAS1
MPSLAELKRATQQALDWLWEWYWSHLESAFGLPSSTPADEGHLGVDTGVTGKLQNILKTYIKSRRSEIKSKRAPSLCMSANTALSTYTLRFNPSATTLPSSSTQTALLRLLVEEKQILPADKKLGSSMSGAFLIWSPLLLTFCSSSPAFYQALLDAVLKEMNDAGLSDEEREGMCEWTGHMLCNNEWKDVRGSRERAVREKVLGDCMTELGTWNLRLAEKIVNSMDKGEGELWRAILDASRSEADEVEECMVVDKVEELEGKKEKVQDMVVMVESEAVDAVPASASQLAPASELSEVVEKTKGPQKVVGLWKPRPIGWLPEGWDEDA